MTEELHDALDVIDAGVAARQKALEELYEVDIAERGEALDISEWFEFTELDYRKEVLGQLVYRALFTVCWSSLEQLLSAFSADLRQDLRLALAERDLDGRGVERSMKYLRKVAGLELNLNEWEWPQIKRYGRLRNHLVHVGPNADDASEAGKTRDLFLMLPGLRIEPAGEIVLTSDFVRRAIRSVEHLLIGVGRAVQKKGSPRS